VNEHAGNGRGPQLFLVGRIWHYRFQKDGIRIQRTTRESSLGKAEKIAWSAYDGEPEVPTLSRLARMWLDVHETTASSAHIRSVEVFTRRHLYHLGEMRIDRIRTEDAEEARGLHLEEHAPNSANHWMRLLKLLFRWAVNRELIPAVPWHLGMFRVQKRPRVILPVAKASEWLAAVDAAAGARWGLATAVRLMLGLGLRESEALSARWEWIDWERSTYTQALSKGRESVPLPLRGWLREHLEPRRVPEGLIVVSPSGGRYCAGATRALVAKASGAIGMKGLTPHRLRGGFATMLAEEGMSVPDIQDLMRHKDARTTLGYIERNLDRAVGALDRIAGRMGMGRENGEARGADARL